MRRNWFIFNTNTDVKKLIVFYLFIICQLTVRGAVTPYIISPLLNQLSDSVLSIQASVFSTEFEIASCTAFVNGRQVNLTYSDGNFYGTMSLTGLPTDTLLLRIVATDVLNNQGADSVRFIYAPRPQVVISSPFNWSNAYPSLPLKGFCTSADNCTLNIQLNIDGQTLFEKNFMNAVDTVVRLNLAPGTSIANGGYIVFTATDKWGQGTSIYQNIFFDNNPYLREVYSCENAIYDFNYNKIFYTDGQKGIIADIHNNGRDTIPGIYPDQPSNVYLTPYGAIFGHTANSKVYDWNNGILYSFGTYGIVNTAGDYATWISGFPSNDQAIHLRKLSTVSDTMIVAESNCPYNCSVENSVAANGLVAFKNSSLNIDKFENGVIIPVTNNGGNGRINSNPLTDGKNIVYMNKPETVGSSYIYQYNGDSISLLSDLGEHVPLIAGHLYQASNNHIAYCKKDSSGQLQIWLKDSTGISIQVSNFSYNSTISLLNPLGDLIFQYGGKIYFAGKGSQPKELGTALSLLNKFYYRDSAWYVVQGRHLYKLLVNAFKTAASGEWTNPATWENNLVPPAGADVIITTNVMVNANVTCNSVRVIAPGSVNVLPGFNMEVLH